MMLNYYNNQLTKLPDLPPNLTELFCYNNQLTELPDLPSTLTHLFCYNNQLTELHELPPNLNILICDSNQLTGLPILPSTLTHLCCFSNQLTGLPILPSTLTHLYCYDNPYLHITSEISRRFNIPETPNYNKKASIIQKIWKCIYRKKRLIPLHRHIEEFLLRPNNFFYQEAMKSFTTKSFNH